MRTAIRSTLFIFLLVLISVPVRAQGTWVQQPTALQAAPTTFVQVGGLWGVAMSDTGTGFAAGYASVANGFSGVLRKLPGNPTWFVLPSSNFAALPNSHSLWSAVTVAGTHVWVCGSNGRLYKTTNNGNNWAEARNGITGTNTLFDIFFKSQTEGMVSGDNGTLYYTSDGGANWVQQTLPATVAATTQLYGIHSAGNNWFISGGTNTIIRGTPSSSSTSWVDLTANVPGIGGIEGLQFLNNSIGIIGGLTFSGSPIFRTTDAGASFTAIGNGLPASNPYNGVFFFHPDTGWVGNSATNIYSTENGGQNWTQATTTPISGQTLSNWLTRIAFPNRNLGFASGGAPGTSSTGWILRYVKPPAPDISTTPVLLDFGTLDCDTTTTKVFTISNTGSQILNLTQITFSSPEFSFVGPPPTSVPISGGTTFSIRWTPTVPGPMPANAGMTITSNDPSHNPWFVQFTGEWNVGAFTLGSLYDFGTTCIGDSLDVNLIVTVSGNYSPKIIAFEHVSGPNYVRLITPTVGSTISGTVPFTFRANPTTGGSISAVYRIISGNPLCPRQTLITFTATVSDADLSLNPIVVDFGEVCVGESKDLEVTISNNGTSPGLISSRIFAGGRNAFPNQHFTPFGPIPPGESRQYQVRFSPNTLDTGNVEAYYKLVVEPCRDTLYLTLKGKGVKPRITFTPTSVLGLGPVPTGQITEENVFITNSGNTALNLSAITLTPVHPRLTLINGPALPMVLPVGQTVSVRVRFSPDRVESILGNICVHWTSPCADSSCLPVAAASGDAPTIEVQPTLNMGTQFCASEMLDTLWVKNTGGGTLTIKRFVLGGSNPGHFTVRGPATPMQVISNDSVAVIIGFLRPDNGSSSADLTIEHDDTKVGSSSIVHLQAIRQSVLFDVQGDTTSAFISCAHVGVSRSLQIRNRGVENLEVRDISVISGAAEFHVASTPMPALVAGGSGLSFEINFTPTQKGIFSGTIQVTVGPCGDTYLINVSGQGNITEVSFAPDPVEFGSVDVGSTDTKTVRITNNGSTALSVNNILLRPGTSEFSLVSLPNLPVIINAGASRDVTVQFAPLSVGTITTNLCIAVTSPCPDTLCVLVRGRGNSIGLGVTKTRMEFQLDACSFTERCDSIEIINDAGTTVTVTDIRIEPAGGFRVEFPGSLPLQLLNGARAMLRVCALPDFTGARTGNLVIVSNDVNVPLIRVPLNALRDSSGIRVSETVIDFGTIAPCEVSASEFVIVTNTGTLAEFLDTLRRNDAFVVSTILPVAMQPGGLTQVRITFVPQTFGVFEDTLYFTTARCGLRVPLIVRGAMWEKNYDVTPVPLAFTNVAVGSSQILNFTFENLHLPSVQIANVQISPSGAFASWGAYPKTVNAGSTIQLPIQYNPTDAGPHSATACIIIDLPCPDTICVSITGSTGEVALSASPSALDFSVLPQCSDFFLNDTLRNFGSGPVGLQSTRIDGANAAYFAIENPVTSPEQLAPGGERVFNIRARSTVPPADGSYSADFVVETNSVAQPQVTVPLQMQRRTLTAPDDLTVDFGTVFVGIASTRSVVVENRGTMAVVFTNANIPAGVTVQPTPPITIAAGGQVTLDVTLTPAAAGAILETLELSAIAPCALLTRIELRGTAQNGLSPTSMNFGQVPICRSTLHTQEVLRNNTASDVSITAARIEGADAAAFTLLQPAAFPSLLSGGGAFTVEMEVTPNASNPPRMYLAELVLTADVDGAIQDLRIPVSADARKSALTLLAPIDFGNISLGSVSPPLAVQFRNDLTYPIAIDSLHFEQVFFGIFTMSGSTPALPTIIPPGGTLNITLTCEPLTADMAFGDIHLFSSDPCDSSKSYPMIAYGIDDAVRATLRIGDHSGMVDDIIDIPVLLQTDLGSTSIASWEGTVSFNRSMLHPIEVILSGTLSADMQPTMSYENAAGRLHITAAGGVLHSGTGTLAIVRMKVLVGDALTSALRIEPDFAFTSGNARVETRQNGEFTLINYCDANGARLIRDSGGLLLKTNRPNPFAGSTVIEYSTSHDGPVDLRVFDSAGREVVVLVSLASQTAGNHRVTFDASRLQPGVYFAVLRSGAESVVRKMLRMD
ncbi:MAG: choice-of-anchor D domain-containing protein [Bacteroidota bacterium]